MAKKAAMTEAGWLAGAEPWPLVLHLAPWSQAGSGRAGDRKLRLWGCGCVRRVWDRVTDPASRAAVEVAERFSDGLATPRELKAAWRAADGVAKRLLAPSGRWGRDEQVAANAALAAYYSATANVKGSAVGAYGSAAGVIYHAGTRPEYLAELAAQAGLVRCVFGNPFRPVVVDPDWRTATVLAVAEAIYADRKWDRLSVLADALEDAGCTDPDVIGHCRGDGPHARGCWVVDLALGRN